MAERSRATQTFYWYDYETFGTDPARDRPVQFAGVRTDADFNVLEEPLTVYCKLSPDSLPHPEACLITGITPQLAEQKGLSEAAFISLIHQQMARPGTCTLGYNNLRFDDEVTRNCLYRNFYDPYAREWQYGNSRWDIIDVVRAARALRPEGIEWPVNDVGRPDFRLEALTKANGLVHLEAHEALSDVHATIAVAKLIRIAQPKLYSFLLQHRTKAAALDLLQLGSFKPLVHVSGKYPALKHCLAIVLPICYHPVNNNGILVYDLSVDPESMISLSADEIKQIIFTAVADLPEGAVRIPLKTVHVNKCPILAPLNVVRAEDRQRLQLDMTTCLANLEKIKAASGLAVKLSDVFSQPYDAMAASDPDLAIYSGGFFSDADKHKMAAIRASAPEKLAGQDGDFADARLSEMLFRYRARNYPKTLNADESVKWRKFCTGRLTGKIPGAGITLQDYFTRLRELKSQNADPVIISALQAYALETMAQLDIKVELSNSTIDC